MNKANCYPGFEYVAEELYKFHFAANIFTIMLKSGVIVHFLPKETQAFRNWLLEHGVQDIGLRNGA